MYRPMSEIPQQQSYMPVGSIFSDILYILPALQCAEKLAIVVNLYHIAFNIFDKSINFILHILQGMIALIFRLPANQLCGCPLKQKVCITNAIKVQQTQTANIFILIFHFIAVPHTQRFHCSSFY